MADNPTFVIEDDGPGGLVDDPTVSEEVRKRKPDGDSYWPEKREGCVRTSDLDMEQIEKDRLAAIRKRHAKGKASAK